MKKLTTSILLVAMLTILLSPASKAFSMSDYGSLPVGNITIVDSTSAVISQDELALLLSKAPLLVETPRFSALQNDKNESVVLTPQDLWVLFVYSGIFDDTQPVDATLTRYNDKTIQVDYLSPGGFMVATKSEPVRQLLARGAEIETETTDTLEVRYDGGWNSTHGCGTDVNLTVRFKERWISGSKSEFKWIGYSLSETAPSNPYYHFEKYSQSETEQSGNSFASTAFFKFRCKISTFSWYNWITFERY